MKALLNDTYVNIDIAASIALGAVVDPRVVALESAVANYYGISVHELKAWTNDSDAKKTMCFLLVYHCNYSIGSVAKQYNIYKHFLRNCLSNLCVKWLSDASYRSVVNGFIDGIKYNTVKAS